MTGVQTCALPISILSGRDERSLRDILDQALSGEKPLSGVWDKFWEEANKLAESRRSSTQQYLIIHTDENGQTREVLRVPLIKEMFQYGPQVAMIVDLAHRIQRELPDVSKVTVAVERSEERRVGKECRSRGSPYH